MNKNRNQFCYTGLYACRSGPCACRRTERIDKFTEVLKHFAMAADATDYEKQISAVISSIITVGALVD
jgi:hypothetical protein